MSYALHCQKLSRQRRDSASNIQRLIDASNVLLGVFCHLKDELRHFNFLRPCRQTFQSYWDGSSYAALRHDYRRQKNNMEYYRPRYEYVVIFCVCSYFSTKNIRRGYSKGPSKRDGPLEYPKQVSKPLDKQILTISVMSGRVF